MGCQCGKRPEDISVSLQKQEEDPSTVKTQNIQLNKDDFAVMNRNKDSSVCFDPLNGQESSQIFKPLINSNTNATHTQVDVAPLSPTKKLLSPKDKDNKNQVSSIQNLQQNQRNTSQPITSEPKSPKSPKKVSNGNGNGNNLISMQQALGIPMVDTYADRILFLLNQIRQDPKVIIPQLTEAKTKIITKNGKLLYISGVKVQLARGEQAFSDAIEFIGTLAPMKPLTANQAIMIESPTSIDQIKTNQHLKDSVLGKVGVKIDYYFRDLVHDPATTLLLAIAGANEKYDNKKRDALLNVNYKSIGITSTVIEKTFCAYFTFA